LRFAGGRGERRLVRRGAILFEKPVGGEIRRGANRDLVDHPHIRESRWRAVFRGRRHDGFLRLKGRHADQEVCIRDYFQIGRNLFRRLIQATDFIIIVAQAYRKRLQDDGCDAKDGTNLHGLDFLSREFTGRLLSIGLLKKNVAEPHAILLPVRILL